MLGDFLADAPDRIKQKLFDAFDVQALQQDQEPGDLLGDDHPVDPGHAGRDHRRQRDPRTRRPAGQPPSRFNIGITTWNNRNVMITSGDRAGRCWLGQGWIFLCSLSMVTKAAMRLARVCGRLAVPIR